MNSIFRMTQRLESKIYDDLLRPQSFAYERIGFVKVKSSAMAGNAILMLGFDYVSVPDEHYIDDKNYGALLGSSAIRSILQIALSEQVGIMLTHMHHHAGTPYFSTTDNHENRKLIPDFFSVASNTPHGALLLSTDSMVAKIWLSREATPMFLDEISIIGSTHKSWRHKNAA